MENRTRGTEESPDRRADGGEIQNSPENKPADSLMDKPENKPADSPVNEPENERADTPLNSVDEESGSTAGKGLEEERRCEEEKRSEEEIRSGKGKGKGKEKGNLFLRLLNSEGMRYLFIGGCTTMVNLVVYAILCRIVHLNVNVSNIISVSVSILFAYIANKLVVFRSHCSSLSELAAECARFIGARLATMVIEVGGVFVLYEILHQNEMVAKLATQVLVVIGNYFISRFLVFRDRNT